MVANLEENFTESSDGDLDFTYTRKEFLEEIESAKKTGNSMFFNVGRSEALILLLQKVKEQKSKVDNETSILPQQPPNKRIEEYDDPYVRIPGLKFC